MNIPLQGDRCTGMTQKFAERFDITTGLQTGGSEGVPEGVRVNLSQRCLFQIALDTFVIAARLYRFCFVSGEKPGVIRKWFS